MIIVIIMEMNLLSYYLVFINLIHINSSSDTFKHESQKNMFHKYRICSNYFSSKKTFFFFVE